MSRYPLALSLQGRRVVVVGGGTVAARRVPVLLDAGADVLLVTPALDPRLEDLARVGRLRLERRPYATGDLAGAWLVHACTDDAAVNERVAAEAEAAGLWCVRADDAAASAAWTPASGSVDGVTVAVTSGDPVRSSRVRDAVLAGLRDGSLPARRVRPGQGRVVLVGGGPGDPDLLTVRGRRLLSQAHVVVTDRLGPTGLLGDLPLDVEVLDVGKSPRGPAARQEEINALLVERARAGQLVVRLKGGDPFVFGRGGEEVLACLESGVPVEVVPGVSSVTGVPTLAGLPLTHRGLVQHFVVAAGHVPPGDPRSTVDWAALGAGSATLVLLMAVENLPAIASALLAAGRPAQTPAAVVQEGSTVGQRVLRSDLGEVAGAAAAAGIVPPAVVVVGEAVAVLPPGWHDAPQTTHEEVR